jgi:hypothetical protein
MPKGVEHFNPFASDYQIRQNHFLGVPAAGLNGENMLSSTMVAKDVAITDYLYGEADHDWSLASSTDLWGRDGVMKAKAPI